MVMKCASLVNGEMALSRKFTILGINTGVRRALNEAFDGTASAVRGKEYAASARTPPLPLDRRAV
jgi:hypothetical protein